MDSRLLDILVCPLSKMPLRPLKRAELDALNHAIAAGQVRSVTDMPVDAALREGLITRDGKIIYRVDDGIPVLLGDEGIGTVQLNDFPR
ncbi:MAG: Trm112 family protein [Metallibacterium scheffleri]|jgi:uncharacterized protein YbaR (Trm112 family)|uniref:Trm112 family protein n=1 Tax=Metallibacterium scheffleri TaxID=993689 RepID=A0A4S3KLI4_9GAMM|nr:Trm112 family protein [Metallibacterium scheffleri]MBU6403315.1 hypothetical protein [Pseudomonadota bacterium]MCK9367746.1 hypothetical protein [Metallibacterium scheffleri]MDE3141564.1 hypothetical protein [Pseudomonadota bacterium]THD09735.1 hypothetical protein B1806_10425 [Metallibacterium scheffleri]